jgi:hypothetical protein
MRCFRFADAVFVNQLAWRLAAAIAAAAALLAVVLTSGSRSHPGSGTVVRADPSVPEAEGPAEGLPSPSEAAQAVPAGPADGPEVTGGDVARAIDFCVNHVTPERSFVVFSNATCVIVDEPCEQPIVDAIHTLEDCSGPNVRFITREIEDGHVLVTYRRAVFNCLFADEIEAQRPFLEANYLALLTSAEKQSMSEGFHPPFHAKLGLLARARLNRDAHHLTVARIIRAKPLDDSASRSRPVDPPVSSPPPLLPGEVPSET